MRNLLLGSLLFLLLAGMAYANGPVLQVSDYSVVPENLYPDSTGQLQVTIHNSGTEMATSTTVYYNYKLDERWDMRVGDIGAGADAITSIPFQVPSSVSSGVIVIKLDLYYYDEDGTSLKTSSVSIPLTVSQHDILEVNTISLGDDSIQKGENLDVTLELVNTGGVMDSVIIDNPDNSSFMLKGATQQRVGDIASNTNKTVSVSLVSSSSAETGRYLIPLLVTYYDSLQNKVTQTVYVGPVTVADPSAQFRISFEPLTPSEIGAQVQYALTIENRGTETRTITVSIDDTDVFTPIGSSDIYFDDIGPGKNSTEIVMLGIDAASASGYYVLPLQVSSDGDTFEYDVGVAVKATPEITLTTELSSSTSSDGEIGSAGLEATIRIANSGNTAIRSVYVSTESTENVKVSGDSEKFIGTLNVDDFANFQVDVQLLKPDSSGAYELPLTIVFKDGDNVEHTLVRAVTLQTGSASLSASSSSQSFDGEQNEAGLSLPLMLAGGAGLLALAYFGYKKWKGNK